MPVTDRVSVAGYVMVSVQFYNPYAAIPAVAERRGSGKPIPWIFRILFVILLFFYIYNRPGRAAYAFGILL